MMDATSLNPGVLARNYDPTIAFLKGFFSSTENEVELRSLPNERGQGSARSYIGRDVEEVEAFLRELDGAQRGTFFGVATRKVGAKHGRREDLAELSALWVDIDCYKGGPTKQEVTDKLRSLPLPPSIIIDSGRGIHAYWPLKEPIDISTPGPQDDELKGELRRLAGVVGGDLNVCDLARVMRLPGSQHTKQEPWAEVTVLYDDYDRRYDLSDISDWLDYQRPVIVLPAPESSRGLGTEDDPFTAAAKRLGYKPPVDVERALKAMSYQAPGQNSIHQTQLIVSASFAARGEDVDVIVDTLMRATRAAAGRDGDHWNWAREEANIRCMTETACAKFADSRTRAMSSKPAENEIVALKAAASGEVIDLTKERNARSPQGQVTDGPSNRNDHVIVQVAQTARKAWEEKVGQLMHRGADTFVYERITGLWRPFDGGDDKLLRSYIQEAINVLGKDPKNTLKSAAHSYIMEDLGLFKDSVEFDRHGKLVFRNGVLDPKTGVVEPHSPDHFATRRIDVIYDPTATAPRWMEYLSLITTDFGEEAAAVIAVVQEWFGILIHTGVKTREMMCALIIYGGSYTGKSQLSIIAKALVGNRVCSMPARVLEQHFGLEALLGTAAWIADDAFSPTEYLDAEWFKVIVTGEERSVARKNKTSVQVKFGIPVLLTTNHLPRVKDDSQAVYNRSILLPLNHVLDRAWVRQQDVGDYASIGEYVVGEELAGVVNWALEGLTRIVERRDFDLPACLEVAGVQFALDNNPVAGWISDCVEKDPNVMVDRRDVYASYAGWCQMEHGIDTKLISPRAFLPMLRHTGLILDEKRYCSGGLDQRALIGLRLTSDGIAMLRYYEANMFNRDVTSGLDDNEVNQRAPGGVSVQKARF
jgi:P4 family phage/plasmid primase-like protien